MFEVHIEMPDPAGGRVTVFRGTVKFGIVRGVRIREALNLSDDLTRA